MGGDEMKKFIKDAIKTAQDLYYPASVEKDLAKAKDENEVTRIMLNARLNYGGTYYGKSKTN